MTFSPTTIRCYSQWAGTGIFFLAEDISSATQHAVFIIYIFSFLYIRILRITFKEQYKPLNTKSPNKTF